MRKNFKVLRQILKDLENSYSTSEERIDPGLFLFFSQGSQSKLNMKKVEDDFELVESKNKHEDEDEVLDFCEIDNEEDSKIDKDEDFEVIEEEDIEKEFEKLEIVDNPSNQQDQNNNNIKQPKKEKITENLVEVCPAIVRITIEEIEKLLKKKINLERLTEPQFKKIEPMLEKILEKLRACKPAVSASDKIDQSNKQFFLSHIYFIEKTIERIKNPVFKKYKTMG